jgi:GntR family transcriptional regulator/MocR family aminotransferase
MKPVLNKIVIAYQSSKQGRSKEAQSLYARLYELIKELIQNNELPQGSILPATRLLSSELGISRSTAIRAYEFLRIEGYVESKPGSGTIIKPLKLEQIKEVQAEHHGYPELSDLGKSFFNNAPLLNSTDDKSVAFRPGLPPLDAFPVNTWKNLSNLYWKNINLSGLSYSPASGIEQLKVNISNYLNLTRGIQCDYSQVFIVSGTLQSLFLTGTCLINKGDSVLIENPTFPNVISIFKGLQADVTGIDIDEEGMKVEDMKAIQQKPKLIHTTPSCHYPIGVQMSLKRRLELLEYANENEAIIIENDYEHELNNWKDSLPALFTLDKEERTIYMGTFNRLLHPSLRIGYMIVPHYIASPLEILLKHSHRFVPTSTQLVLNQFIEKKHLYHHLQNVVNITEKRRIVFTEYFEERFAKSSLAMQPETTKSLQLLLNLRSGKDKELVELFARHNIVTHSYHKCFVKPTDQQGLILGYSPMRIPMLKTKVQQMSQLINL